MEDWGPPLPPRKPAGLPTEVYIQHPGYITAGDAIQFNCMVRDRNLDTGWTQRIMTVRKISLFEPSDAPLGYSPVSHEQVSVDELKGREHDIWVDTREANRFRYTHIRHLTRATREALETGGAVDPVATVKGAVV